MDVDVQNPRPQRGMTLVEMLTTLAVASILLALIAPSLGGVAERSRITSTANSLLTDLRYARSTAVTHNTRIGLCPSTNGTQCSGDPRTWHDGYIVFEDSDDDRDRGINETILRSTGAGAPSLRLHSTAGRPAISFSADGAAWSTNTTFSVCLGDDDTFYRAVVLYGSGRARVDNRAPGNRRVRCN